MKKIGKEPSNLNQDNPIIPIILDGLEVLLDSKLEDNALKDTPVFGTLLNFYKSYNTIRDRFFFRKLTNFIQNLDRSKEEVDEFWSQFEDDEEAKYKLGEQLIIYIDRYENVEKPALLANAFSAYTRRWINYSDFLDLASVIDSLKIHHLEKISRVLYRKDGHAPSKASRVGGADLKVLLVSLEREGLLLRKDKIEMKLGQGFTGSEKESFVQTTNYSNTILANYFIAYVIPDIFEKSNPGSHDAVEKIIYALNQK